MTQPEKRLSILRTALHALLTADVSECERVFTPDVTVRSPVLSANSRDELETLLSSRADALRDVEVALDTERVQPWGIPQDSDLASPPRRVTLVGKSVAQFRGTRISSIRSDFDPAVLTGPGPGELDEADTS